RSTNSLLGTEAVNLLLAKVPSENGVAPAIDTYVWLTGEPISLTGLNDKSYTKAGVITITAEADLTSGLTPNTTPYRNRQHTRRHFHRNYGNNSYRRNFSNGDCRRRGCCYC
ncbi:MAG: hypothetical protein RR263_05785, partial [Oscillospiraceae bacterium]